MNPFCSSLSGVFDNMETYHVQEIAGQITTYTRGRIQSQVDSQADSRLVAQVLLLDGHRRNVYEPTEDIEFFWTGVREDLRTLHKCSNEGTVYEVKIQEAYRGVADYLNLLVDLRHATYNSA
jgi:hypothetical protein